MLRALRLLGFIALATLHCASHADTLTDQARALLDGGRAREAFALLLPMEPERAGDVDYDYLLGLAALDSGDAERAVFALERVLAQRPGFAQARAEIARAYIALGDREGARRELQAVKSLAPPTEVRETIDRFLAAIARPPTRFSGYVEATLGVDSNINSATGLGSLAIPAIGPVTLGPGLTRLSDTFAGLAAGVNVAYPINDDLTIVSGLRATSRLNAGDSLKTQFDTASVDFDAGVRWARTSQDTLTLGFQAQTFELDNARYRDSSGLIGQWQRALSDTRQLTFFAQYAALRYPTQAVRDADRTIAGIAYAQSFAMKYSPVLFVSAYAGTERERAAGVPHLGHDPLGLRLGVQLTLQPERLFLNAFVGHEQRRYGGPEPLFGVDRKDGQTDLRLALTWKLKDGWSVTPQVSHTDNRSNVSLFRYDRTVTSLALRKEF